MSNRISKAVLVIFLFLILILSLATFFTTQTYAEDVCTPYNELRPWCNYSPVSDCCRPENPNEITCPTVCW